MRVFLIAVLFALTSLTGFSTHIISFELSYQHLYDSTYVVSCDAIYSCGGSLMWLGGSPLTPQFFNFGVACASTNQSVAKSLPIISEDTLQTFCWSSQSLNACSSSTGLSGFRLARYSDTLNLNDFPSCDTIRLRYQSGARTSSVNVLSQPSYHTNIEIDRTADNLNSSTENWHFDMPSSFTDSSDYSFSLAGFDIDGDSLTYSLDTAWSFYSNGTYIDVSYANGYNALNPIPNFSIDSHTGLVNWQTSIPSGFNWANYIVNVRTDEWDAQTGQFKGSRFRDMQFWVLPSPGAKNPIFDGMTNLSGATELDSMDIIACAGDTFCFDVTFSDLDLADTVSITSNLEYFADYYSITQTGVNPATATICAVINRKYDYGIDAVIKARDSHCPMIGMSSVRLHIRTVGSENQSIYGCYSNSDTMQVQADSIANWSVLSGDTISSLTFNCLNTGCTQVALNPFNSTTYLVENVMSYGCSFYDTVYVLTDSTYLMGTALDASSNPVSGASVYRFQYDAQNDTVFLLDSALTNINGEYAFGLGVDSFLIKVSPDSASYPNLMPTYYDQQVTVPSADFIYPDYCDTLELTNTLVAGQNPGGAGFIGGYVSQGAGRAVGDPVKGVGMVLMDDLEQPIGYKVTNAQGYFRFNNLNQETYYVNVDRWGINNSIAPSVMLTEEMPSVDSLEFLLFSNRLEIVKPTGVSEKADSPIRVYPNPSNDNLHVKSLAPLGEIELYNAIGSLVYQASENGLKAELGVAHLPSGCYTLVIENEQGKRDFHRVVISH